MLRAKITFVDKYGFNGREFHPKESDLGLTVFVLAMQTETDRAVGSTTVDGNGFLGASQRDGELSALVASAIRIESLGVWEEGDDHIYQIYFCVTADGRKLELIDHEIELLKNP